ncbi:hypothetical protein CK620_07970 [Vandammella animalimorsus]|uniref:Uncharacterized protein n=1 Tax=Vandammella animalimorsus TaxID=2029117 RepID=A0A2A2A8G3_9BURK|nr:hypothetical protein CK620_07970 [Vandammella animalimorsus]
MHGFVAVVFVGQAQLLQAEAEVGAGLDEAVEPVVAVVGAALDVAPCLFLDVGDVAVLVALVAPDFVKNRVECR